MKQTNILKNGADTNHIKQPGHESDLQRPGIEPTLPDLTGLFATQSIYIMKFSLKKKPKTIEWFCPDCI
jgi:hypothetical protein